MNGNAHLAQKKYWKKKGILIYTINEYIFVQLLCYCMLILYEIKKKNVREV
jgi:hypothetical protein